MYQQMRATSPLSNETLMRLAPSIFAEHASERVSDQYKMIPTIETVEAMRSDGWFPVSVSQQRVKTETRQGFQKHMIRFRKLGENEIQVGDSLLEAILTNAHDALSAYTITAGLFRLVCSNGLVVSDSTIEKVSIVHKGFQPQFAVDAAKKLTERLPELQQKVDSFRTIELSQDERQIFASSAMLLKYEDQKASPIAPEKLLTPRRYAEEGKKDLWSTFNVVQENLLNGGQRGRTANNARTSTRAVTGIDSNMKLNKALWSLAEKMKELKAA